MSLELNAKPVPQILAAKQRERRNKGRKKPLRLRKVPRQRLPKSAERQLRSRIFKLLQRARTLVQERLLPRLQEIEGRAIITIDARADVEPWPETLDRIMVDIRREFAPIEAQMKEATAIAADQVSEKNRREIGRQLESVLGLDVFIGEPELAATLAASVSESVGLIKSIPQRYFDDIEGIILRGFRGGQRASALAPEISKRFNVSRKKAAFIARDQIEKLNSDLTRNRQINLGIPSYIWRTSLDERVRPDHARLEGTVQSWDKAPVVDSRSGRRAHPGGDFNCRCTAEPNIEALLD